MPRRALSLMFTVAIAAVAHGGSARADDDPRFALPFLQGLRDRGYYDLALSYLDDLRKSPDTPPNIKARLDFEEGRALVDAATHSSDPQFAKEKLDIARNRLDAYIKANPGKPESVEALVELAHLLYERGRNTAIEADDSKTPPEKEAKLVESRGFYESARTAYGQAFERLESKFKTFPNFIEDGEPLKAEKERVQTAMMNAELQKAVTDYEEAQTWPLGSPQRNEILTKTSNAFEDVYKRHRTQLAGITARMWQGKCYEEKGALGDAKGIYDELLQHTDPRLRGLQKRVDYFRIILMGKRKDYALAADEAFNWLREFPNDRRSYEALGVQLELAKSMMALIPDANPEEKGRALKRVTEILSEIVRTFSPFKAEALAMLTKISPKTAFKLDTIAGLSFDDAEGQANSSVTSQDYEKAILILRVALKKGTGTQPVEKLNKTRYTLAFCCYMTKRYYEAAALTEYLGRRYPGGEWSAKATEIGLPALIDAYNTYTAGDRTSDLRRIEELAKYMAETWPDAEQGDIGRMTSGQIALGSGRYAEAIAAFEAVRTASSKWADAQAAAGDAHWKQSLTLRDDPKNPAAKADAEAQKAVASYQAAIKNRKDVGAGNADLALVANVCDLGTIDLEVGKPEESLKLLEPHAKALATATRTSSQNLAFARVMATRLRGHVAVGQVDLALGDMNTLEQSGGAGDDRVRLYYELGKLLEKEMENLVKKNDKKALDRTQQAYRKFLGALVASKSGQTFDSLFWAGSSLLKLESYNEASTVFDQIVQVYGDDSAFLARPGAADRLLVVRLRQVSALRGKKEFDAAEGKLREINERNPRLLDAQMEKGHILSDRAASKQGNWSAASDYWQKLALRLKSQNPKPPQYFEAWYQAAKALQGDGKTSLAKQTLNGIMRLSPQVGSPEIKARYQKLLAELK